MLDLTDVRECFEFMRTPLVTHTRLGLCAHTHVYVQGWLKHENYVFGARKLIDIPQGVMASHICESSSCMSWLLFDCSARRSI